MFRDSSNKFFSQIARPSLVAEDKQLILEHEEETRPAILRDISVQRDGDVRDMDVQRREKEQNSRRSSVEAV